ncbi:hypothetical protein P3S68_011238 [Capsicum galapagoense]
MSFAAHQRKLKKLKGRADVTPAEVFAETHKKEEEDSTREGWIKTRAKETYEEFQKSLKNWCQTQPTSVDGTAVQPLLTQMNSIWTEVVDGPNKGRVYGLGVIRSSSRPSPLLSSASTSQNSEEMEEMRKEIAELKMRCKTFDDRVPKFEKLIMKYMPQARDDEDDTESDED